MDVHVSENCASDGRPLKIIGGKCRTSSVQLQNRTHEYPGYLDAISKLNTIVDLAIDVPSRIV